MPLSAETALLSFIDEHLSAGRPLTLAIDGCCAAGKTTLALRLQQRYGCPVFHADDYFLQPHQRTPQRLSQAFCPCHGGKTWSSAVSTAPPWRSAPPSESPTPPFRS